MHQEVLKLDLSPKVEIIRLFDKVRPKILSCLKRGGRGTVGTVKEYATLCFGHYN